MKRKSFMFIRKSTKNDISALMPIFEEARGTIAALGIDQWQNGYPSEEVILADISLGQSYLCEIDGKVCGTFAMLENGEPTYDKIYDGHWLTGDDSRDYIAIHRVAISVATRGSGLSGKIIGFAADFAKEKGRRSLRIDTHRGNAVMRRMLEKNGFKYCGVIYLEGGDERVAYEKILSDDYSEMAKNTVDSQNQLKESSVVRFHNLGGGGKRVMFVGNSITLHGKAPQIGWNLECGMAASAPEKDYVHLLERAVLEVDPEAAFCVCQVAGWERSYKQGEETYPLYEAARAFDADIIVLRFIENCPAAEFEPDVFYRSVGELVKYLNADGEAKIIVTTGFWRHPGDAQLCAYARDNGYPLVPLGDLGQLDEMKAIGLFEHSGVANHPGDEGMRNIAERIWAELLPFCK